uniref:Putative leucine-rich repeat receptor-like serine/threonine-protein kinase n=1 Tax=Rhizophora mucronata TaxID=61149 RepID=A0A2P2MWL8_RHIMU
MKPVLNLALTFFSHILREYTLTIILTIVFIIFSVSFPDNKGPA